VLILTDFKSTARDHDGRTNMERTPYQGRNRRSAEAAWERLLFRSGRGILSGEDSQGTPAGFAKEEEAL